MHIISSWQSWQSYQAQTLLQSFVGALQAGCSAIANLCKQLPSDALRPQHDALLASLLPNLGHQHSRVRVSTLAALDTLVTKVQILPMASTLCTAVRCCSERRERLLLCLYRTTYESILFQHAWLKRRELDNWTVLFTFVSARTNEAARYPIHNHVARAV